MSLLIPRHVRISRAVNIATNNQKAMQLISDTTQWTKWNPLFSDSVHANTKNISREIITSTDSIISINIQAKNSDPVLNTWELHRLASRDSAALQWYMDFHPKWYPWEKFKSLFYEKAYGTMMEQGLENVQRISAQ
jgi:hypothetical protein